MGNIANDMMRLHNEIKAAKNKRSRLIRRTKNAAAFLKNGVSNMLSDFHNTHKDTFEKNQASRSAFISHIEHTVGDIKRGTADMRKEFKADIIGAHRAWSGR